MREIFPMKLKLAQFTGGNSTKIPWVKSVFLPHLGNYSCEITQCSGVNFAIFAEADMGIFIVKSHSGHANMCVGGDVRG